MGRPSLTDEQRAVAIERKRQKNREWNKAHPEAMCKASKAWAGRNPEKVWRVINRDQSNAGIKAWYAANRERKLAQNKAWNKANIARGRENLRNWRLANPEKYRADKKARQIRKKKELRAFLMVRQGGRCAICQERLGGKTHIDHIMPRKLGGTNARSNFQLTCPPCNWSKGPKHPIDHARSLGRLL